METERPKLAIRVVIVMKKTGETPKRSGYLVMSTRKPKKTNLNKKEEASTNNRN